VNLTCRADPAPFPDVPEDPRIRQFGTSTEQVRNMLSGIVLGYDR